MPITLQAHVPTISIWSWHFDPFLIFAVYLAGFFYLRSIRRRRAALGGVQPIERRRVVSFFAGLTVAALSLLSPLEPLADDYLLSAHMVQHLALTIATPLLMLYGMAPWMYDAFKRVPALWRTWRILTLPILAFVLFHLPYSISHVPTFYDLTLRSLPVHMLEHAVYTSTAFLVWWPLMAPSREDGQFTSGLQILYLFVQTLPGQVVGAMITNADNPLYNEYDIAPRIWGLSTMVDQQIGGLIMWIGTSTFYLAAIGVVFFRWASSEDKAERTRMTPRVTPPVG